MVGSSICIFAGFFLSYEVDGSDNSSEKLSVGQPCDEDEDCMDTSCCPNWHVCIKDTFKFSQICTDSCGGACDVFGEKGQGNRESQFFKEPGMNINKWTELVTGDAETKKDAVVKAYDWINKSPENGTWKATPGKCNADTNSSGPSDLPDDAPTDNSVPEDNSSELGPSDNRDYEMLSVGQPCDEDEDCELDTLCCPNWHVCIGSTFKFSQICTDSCGGACDVLGEKGQGNRESQFFKQPGMNIDKWTQLVTGDKETKKDAIVKAYDWIKESPDNGTWKATPGKCTNESTTQAESATQAGEPTAPSTEEPPALSPDDSSSSSCQVENCVSCEDDENGTEMCTVCISGYEEDCGKCVLEYVQV